MFEVLTTPPAGVDLDGEQVWIPVRSGVVFTEPGGGLVRAQAPPVEGSARSFLGMLDGTATWAIDMAAAHDHEGRAQSTPDEGDLEPVPLRKLFGRVPDEHWVVAGRAEQIVNYERTHRYCGRCATATLSVEADRGRKCPNCGHMAFPRLSPAMIVLVERDDHALLAWGTQFPGRFFSTLAGFVEPGESLEDAVAREVKEEVSVAVRDVTYFGSQPWPFPHSLMCGFVCQWESGEIDIDPTEIVEADWFTPDDLPPCPRGGMSIAGWLIDDWAKRHGH